jgi:class 3 adenylate cyclase
VAETSDIPGETLREWARDYRVTLAIVFTDIVGAAALGRALGDEQMNGVRRAHFGHSRALLAQHAGREIKTIGDSVMAVFRSIGAALDYAHGLYISTRGIRCSERAGCAPGFISVRSMWSGKTSSGRKWMSLRVLSAGSRARKYGSAIRRKGISNAPARAVIAACNGCHTTVLN